MSPAGTKPLAAIPNGMRLIAARRSLPAQFRDVWLYRELVGGLVTRELKVRYKNSALGFLWSMAQPVFLLVVYTAVFSILGAGFENFAVWVMSGLIVWTLLATSLTTSAQSVTSNSYLVSKVTFPRIILPLSTSGSALVHFALQLATLGVILLVAGHDVAWSELWLLPLAIVVVVVLCAALGSLLSVVNVYARDTQHLLDLLMVAWFWATPIIYQYERTTAWLAERSLPTWLPLLNPMTPVVTAFQRAVYGTNAAGDRLLLPDVGTWWYARNLGIVGIASMLLLAIAFRLFDRAEGNFAEVL